MSKPRGILIGIGAALITLIVILTLVFTRDDSTGGEPAAMSSPTSTFEPATATTDPPAIAPATVAPPAADAGAEVTSPAGPGTTPTVAPLTTPPAATSTVAAAPTTDAATTTLEPAVVVPWAGTWELIEESGGPPGAPAVTPGVDYFITLTITDSAFQSDYSDTFGQACGWEGTSTPEGENTLAWAHISSSEFPCSQGDGRSGLVVWVMPEPDTLVLDFGDLPGGTADVPSNLSGHHAADPVDASLRPAATATVRWH
jgi:hypothetical protein